MHLISDCYAATSFPGKRQSRVSFKMSSTSWRTTFINCFFEPSISDGFLYKATCKLILKISAKSFVIAFTSATVRSSANRTPGLIASSRNSTPANSRAVRMFFRVSYCAFSGPLAPSSLLMVSTDIRPVPPTVFARCEALPGRLEFALRSASFRQSPCLWRADGPVKCRLYALQVLTPIRDIGTTSQV